MAVHCQRLHNNRRGLPVGAAATTVRAYAYCCAAAATKTWGTVFAGRRDSARWRRLPPRLYGPSSLHCANNVWRPSPYAHNIPSAAAADAGCCLLSDPWRDTRIRASGGCSAKRRRTRKHTARTSVVGGAGLFLGVWTFYMRHLPATRLDAVCGGADTLTTLPPLALPPACALAWLALLLLLPA